MDIIRNLGMSMTGKDEHHPLWVVYVHNFLQDWKRFKVWLFTVLIWSLWFHGHSWPSPFCAIFFSFWWNVSFTIHAFVKSLRLLDLVKVKESIALSLLYALNVRISAQALWNFISRKKKTKKKYFIFFQKCHLGWLNCLINKLSH